MSTAKRLVLSLRGRNYSPSNGATSSTRLVSAGNSSGHELDEIAIVSGTGSSSNFPPYGGSGGIGGGNGPCNGPRYSEVREQSATDGDPSAVASAFCTCGDADDADDDAANTKPISTRQA